MMVLQIITVNVEIKLGGSVQQVANSARYVTTTFHQQLTPPKKLNLRKYCSSIVDVCFKLVIMNLSVNYKAVAIIFSFL